MAKKESCLLILVKMVLLMALLVAGVIAGVFYAKDRLNEFFNRGDNVEVPDFRGKHLLTVFKEKPAELIIEKRDEKFDPRYPKDYVIAQYPDPGTRVKPNKKVLLTISMGSKMVAVPDLVDKSPREAELALLNAQLKEGNRSYIATSRVRRDRIVAQSPLPSNERETQGNVDLLVSLGTGQSRSPLPSLIGKTLPDAKTNLQGWGLREGKILFRRDPNRPKMQVIATRPTPYEQVAEGTPVDLLVSNGSDPDTGSAEEFKRFEFVDAAPIQSESAEPAAKTADKPAAKPAKPADVPPPPRILLADEPEPEVPPQVLPPVPEPAAETPAPAAVPKATVTFVMPDGFMPKEVKFFQVSPQGRQQVYAGTHKPLDQIRVDVPRIPDSKVQIYINDVPIEDRPVQ
ncbi:MAG TPA: PASTA domain-containing protein [Candidatus Ozemobacteraceae bacterium]|nr:PASTA domain-containing protein [Candidatus Ozemobacteraceae bacterium]